MTLRHAYPAYDVPSIDSLADIVTLAAGPYARDVAFEHADGRVMTYAELAARVASLAGWLSLVPTTAGGLRELPQGASASQGPWVRIVGDDPELVATAFLATAWVDGVAVLGPLEDVPVDVALDAEALAKVLAGVAGEACVAGAPAKRIGRDLDAARCILGSSGTSGGAPKRVVLSERALVADLLGGLALYAFPHGGRTVSVIPPWHGFGLVCDLLAPLATGQTIGVPGDPLAALAQLPRFAPTQLNVPPRFASALLALLEARLAALRAQDGLGGGAREAPRPEEGCPRQAQMTPYGTAAPCGAAAASSPLHARAARAVTGGHLRKLLCGGAGLDADVSAGLRAFGIEAYGCYGLSECAPCVSVNRDAYHKDGSAGLPLACNEVRIAPDGEILVRGANVMAGYLGQAELTARILRDGWLHTGDVGRLDADGFLWVEGRLDSLIVLADGTKVAPEPWERALLALDGVAQALVCGTPTPAGTALAARVFAPDVVRSGRAVLERAIRAVALDGRHAIERVEFVEAALLTTPTGKLVRGLHDRKDHR